MKEKWACQQNFSWEAWKKQTAWEFDYLNSVWYSVIV